MTLKKKNQKLSSKNEDLPGDPVYSEKDDIYYREKKEQLPEDRGDMEEDLVVPGSELDNSDEEIGEEDEENNYYSIGGDYHHDLEEGNPDM